MKIYTTIAKTILMYGSETWDPSQQEMNKLQTAEIKRE